MEKSNNFNKTKLDLNELFNLEINRNKELANRFKNLEQTFTDSILNTNLEDLFRYSNIKVLQQTDQDAKLLQNGIVYLVGYSSMYKGHNSSSYNFNYMKEVGEFFKKFEVIYTNKGNEGKYCSSCKTETIKCEVECDDISQALDCANDKMISKEYNLDDLWYPISITLTRDIE